MKKFISLTLTTIMVCGLFISSLTPVRAALGVKDQANEVYSSGYYQNLTGTNYGQSFMPTKNRISRISVYLREEVTGSGITITLKDHTSGDTIMTTGHRLDGLDGWESFSFDSSPVEVTPEHRYAIYITANNSSVAWSRSNTNAYDRGNIMHFGSPIFGDDYMFIQEGFDYSPPAEDDPPASQPSDQSNTQDSTVADTEDEALKANDVKTEVDASIEAPKLTYIKINEEQIDTPIEGEVEALGGDTLTVFGTSFAGARVVLFVGDYAFSNLANQDENWEILVDFKDLEFGNFEVTAQAQQVESSKGSEIVDFFTFNYKEKPKVATTLEKELNLWEKLIGPWQYYTYATLLALLIVLLLILHQTQKKHLAKHAGKKADKNSELDSKVDLSKLDKITEKPKKSGKKFIDIAK